MANGGGNESSGIRYLMNIFVLHRDPKEAAKMHTDKHVRQQSIEYAQLLSSAHRACSHPEEPALVGLYKMIQEHHPTTIWARTHPLHYAWLYELACATWEEYTYRTGKVHASSRLRRALARVPKISSLKTDTPPPQCIPDIYKITGSADTGDNTWDATVNAYRKYYGDSTIESDTWKRRDAPEWFHMPVP
jgi:hypothetical protein